MRFLLILLMTTPLYALEPSDYLGSSREESGRNHYLGGKRQEARERAKAKARKKYKPQQREMTNVYFKKGFSLGKLSVEREKVKGYGLGILKTSGNTYFGLEYSKYKNSQARTHLFQFQYGWTPKNWGNKLIPFAGLQAGYSSSSFKSGGFTKGDGLALGIDFGVEIFRYLLFNTRAGVKSTWTFLEESKGEDQRILDLYLAFGLRF